MRSIPTVRVAALLATTALLACRPAQRVVEAVEAAATCAEGSARDLPRISEAWHFDEMGMPLAADDDLVLTSTNELTALDAWTGAVRWRLGECACRITPGILLTPTRVYAARMVRGGKHSVVALDRTDGREIWSRDVDDFVIGIAGPPLVVELGNMPIHSLLRLDEDSGEIIARRDNATMMVGAIVGDVVLANVDATLGSAGFDGALMGLRAADLQPAWSASRPELDSVVTAGELVFALPNGESSLVKLDPRTGDTGPALPLPRGPRDAQWVFGSAGLAGARMADVEMEEVTNTCVRVRRMDRASGAEIWSVVVPTAWGAWRMGDRFVVACDSEMADGIVVSIDWTSGRIVQRAFGLPRNFMMKQAGALLVAEDGSRVVAYSLDGTQPSLATTESPAQQAARVLDDPDFWDAAKELRALGEPAVPAIIERIPTMEGRALESMVPIVAARPEAATAIAKRLAAELDALSSGAERTTFDSPPFGPLVEALDEGKVTTATPDIVRVLRDERVEAAHRRADLAALTRMGAPEAQAAVAKFLDQPDVAPHAWLEASKLRAEEAPGPDHDGDGLDDSLEPRLGLDASSPDTDGDGIRDGEDLAPNAGKPAPAADDVILLAIFRQFFMFRDEWGDDQLVVMHDVPALEWRGRTGPTVTLDAESEKDPSDDDRSAGILYVTIRPGPQDTHDEEEPARVVADGDRLYSLSTWCGPLCGVGYEIVMRRVTDRWIIADIDMIWIS